MNSKARFFTIIAFSLLSLTLHAEKKGYHKILGLWEFSAPAAPQPYQSGSLSLKEVDQKLTGELIVQGQAMPIPKISFESDTLTLNFEVENTPITLVMKLSDGQLEGNTDTPDGPVNVKAKLSDSKTRIKKS